MTVALTESEIESAFTGLQNWVTQVEDLLAQHTQDSCIMAAQLGEVTVPGQTLTQTLDVTLDQVALAVADPRFTAYPAQQLHARLTAARDAWFLLCASHGFDPQ